MKSLISLSSLFLGTASISYGGYELLRPKNIAQYLKWKGYSLVGNNENTWKAIYLENSNHFASVEELRNYCTRALFRNDFKELNSVVSYCVDNLRTVRGQLIKEGLENKLIKGDEEYKIGLILRKGNIAFLELVSNDINKYKEWCNANLEKKPSLARVANVKTFCIPKPYKTASEKLVHDGLKRLTKEQLVEKHKALNITNLSNHPLIKDIFKEKDLPKLSDSVELQKEFGEAYSKWCDTEASRSLADEGFYPSGYAKFRDRCADITELQKVWKTIEEIKKNNPTVQDISNFEKDNKCNLYFTDKGSKNSAYRAEDPVWARLQLEDEYSHRNLYEEFKSFINTDKAKKLCKEAKGRRILLKRNPRTYEWN